MKHVFIINPMSGASNQAETTIAEINKMHCIESVIYVTKDKKDATSFVKEYIKNNPDEEARFYACGGDGTINEVVSGLVGEDKSLFSMTCYPVGSGNDYIKIFGGKDKFMNIDKLINAKNKEVDVMEVNDGEGYAINVINYGFACNVVKVMEQIKRNKKTTNEKAYKKAVIKSVVGCRHNLGETYVGNEKMNEKEFLLGDIANGQYVGGQFKCAPKSICDDGMLEFSIFKPISIPTFALLLKPYTNGTFLDDKRFAKINKYKRTNEPITITGPEGFCICLDGELLFGQKFVIKNIKRAVNFAVPE